MRWIFLSLVFANAGYFAWAYYQQSHQTYEQFKYVEESPAQQGKRLVLLSEARKSLKSAARDNQDNNKEGSEKSVEQCLVVGPFSSANRADELQQRLFSLGVTSRERSDDESRQVDYWVHIPPLANRQAAIRLLRELQAQQIDSFVITQGELSNGISLGLFSKEGSANDVSRRLLQAGYTTEIKLLPRTPETFWLEMNLEASELLAEDFWSELANDYKDLKMLEKSCKGIASSKAIH